MIKRGVSCDSTLVCLHYSPINPFPPVWAPSKRRISTCNDGHPQDGQTLIKGWPALPMPEGASELPYCWRLAGYEGLWGSILPSLPSATLSVKNSSLLWDDFSSHPLVSVCGPVKWLGPGWLEHTGLFSHRHLHKRHVLRPTQVVTLVRRKQWWLYR